MPANALKRHLLPRREDMPLAVVALTRREEDVHDDGAMVVSFGR